MSCIVRTSNGTILLLCKGAVSNLMHNNIYISWHDLFCIILAFPLLCFSEEKNIQFWISVHFFPRCELENVLFFNILLKLILHCNLLLIENILMQKWHKCTLLRHLTKNETLDVWFIYVHSLSLKGYQPLVGQLELRREYYACMPRTKSVFVVMGVALA